MNVIQQSINYTNMNYLDTWNRNINNTIHNHSMNKAGQKRGFAGQKSPQWKNLEDEARLFYRLATVRDRKYRFRTYRSCFVGKEMVDAMLANELAKTRTEAVLLACALAEQYQLFQSCENSILTNSPSFEDSPHKFYRFSSGALKVVRDLDEHESSSAAKPATPTPSIGNKNTRPGLERQNATRTMQPGIIHTVDDDNEEEEVWDDSINNIAFKTNQKADSHKTTRKSYVPPLPPMEAIVEDEDENENEDETTSKASTKVSSASTTKTEYDSLREIQRLAREQAEFERTAVELNLSKEEKTRLESSRIKRLRSLAKEILLVHNHKRRPSSGADRIMDAIKDDRKEHDDPVVIDTKERMMADIVAKLEKNHSHNWVVKARSLMSEVDSTVSTLYTGDHHIVESHDGDIIIDMESKNDDNNEDEDGSGDIVLEALDVEETENLPPTKTSSTPVSEKGKKWKQRLEAKKASRKAKSSATDENIREEIVEPVVEEKEEEEDDDDGFPKFVLSVNDLPPNIRRRPSDFTETFDTFESMMNKKSKNVLDHDDSASVWTECIIPDEEGREQYRQNEIKRSRPSYMSYYEETVVGDVDDDSKSYMEFTVADETYYDEETIYDEETVVSTWRSSYTPSATSLKSFAKSPSDEQSIMGFSVLAGGDGDDDSTAVSYVEDDEDYVAPEEHRVLPTSEENDGDGESFFPVYAIDNSQMDDDEMTQITMDHALLQRKSSISIQRRSNLVVPTSFSSSPSTKKRIQQVLWNDLYSCDVAVVRSAMEDLRTVIVSEPEHRKQIVRMGGVMAIMGTMEEYSNTEAIQYLSFVIIELLASMEPEARKIVNEFDGIQLIVRSMGGQADSDRVQEAGRAALATVCGR